MIAGKASPVAGSTKLNKTCFSLNENNSFLIKKNIKFQKPSLGKKTTPSNNVGSIKKNKFAKKADFKIYLTTQFFFEAKSLIDWEVQLNKLENNLEIHAGIPGPASLKTLISYAKSCGIGNSLRFLTKQAFNIAQSTKAGRDYLVYT